MDEDGYFWFEGRDDDVITSSAYRIGPFEVESVLVEHPAVIEAAVVGKDDPERTQIVTAFCLLAPGHTGSDELAHELQQFVKTEHRPLQVPPRDPLRRGTAQDHQRQDPALRNSARGCARDASTARWGGTGPSSKHRCDPGAGAPAPSNTASQANTRRRTRFLSCGETADASIGETVIRQRRPRTVK